MYNRAKFLQNGGCGFVLKPSVLLDPENYSLTNISNMDRLPALKVGLLPEILPYN